MYSRKSVGLLSYTNLNWSAVEEQDARPYLKSERKPRFWRLSTILLCTGFLKILLIPEIKVTGTTRISSFTDWQFQLLYLSGKADEEIL